MNTLELKFSCKRQLLQSNPSQKEQGDESQNTDFHHLVLNLYDQLFATREEVFTLYPRTL